MSLRRAAVLAAMVAISVAAAQPVADEVRVTPIVKAYRQAGPAVVNISTEKIERVRMGFFDNDPFEDIFPFPSPFVRDVPVQSLGSGVIVHPSGYIVTNAHVVRRAQKITVTLADQTKYTARVISADSQHDLAVLKIDPPQGTVLPRLPLGRSDDLMVGESVIAIGNPLGLANTVTVGVVSAVNRTLTFSRDVEYAGLIQIDAPINPGNSGGPLLNIKGELIGINTAIRADAQNIGFAIPADTLARQLGELLDFQQIKRVVFGAKVARRPADGGCQVLVEDVAAGSPADGRLQVGDRILAVNDQPVAEIADYTCAMFDMQAGRPVTFKVLRDGKELGVAVPIAERPKPDGKALAAQRLGLTLRPVTPQMAAELGLPISSGLMVIGVEEGSPANKLGVELKDVLFQVGQFYVTDLDQLGMALEPVRSGQAVMIGMARGNIRALVNIVVR